VGLDVADVLPTPLRIHSPPAARGLPAVQPRRDALSGLCEQLWIGGAVGAAALWRLDLAAQKHAEVEEIAPGADKEVA
jgi:hypothetical protein